MIKIKFRQLFHRYIEGEYMFPAIIVYRDTPYLQKTSTDKKGISSVYIAQYSRELTIDCWLFMLRIKWLTKELFND